MIFAWLAWRAGKTSHSLWSLCVVLSGKSGHCHNVFVCLPSSGIILSFISCIWHNNESCRSWDSRLDSEGRWGCGANTEALFDRSQLLLKLYNSLSDSRSGMHQYHLFSPIQNISVNSQLLNTVYVKGLFNYPFIFKFTKPVGFVWGYRVWKLKGFGWIQG